MSSKKNLKRERNAATRVPLAAAAGILSPLVQDVQTEPKRAAFTLTITFDPANDVAPRYDTMAVGGGDARIGDILNALQMTRDDVLTNVALNLARQQMQAQSGSSPETN